MISEHYATDVPRLTRIVEPEEHEGKLIMTASWNPDARRVVFVTDAGERIEFESYARVKVSHGPERAARVAWARRTLGMEL